MTAVEWLIDQIINNNGVNQKTFDQAKQFEAKQQNLNKMNKLSRTDEPLVLNDFNNKEFYITEFGNDKEMSFIIGIENAYVNLTKEDAIKIKNFIDKQLK